jgi:hypothetical protein
MKEEKTPHARPSAALPRTVGQSHKSRDEDGDAMRTLCALLDSAQHIHLASKSEITSVERNTGTDTTSFE